MGTICNKSKRHTIKITNRGVHNITIKQRCTTITNPITIKSGQQMVIKLCDTIYKVNQDGMMLGYIQSDIAGELSSDMIYAKYSNVYRFTYY